LEEKKKKAAVEMKIRRFESQDVGQQWCKPN